MGLFYAVILGIVGLPFAPGGVYLISLDESWYDTLAGFGLMVAAHDYSIYD
ncbi:hypothetical protein W03_14580 [Nitrosomonas sp. PY1]|uniref:hypothetical protein n=1 Tax=Nitrosomonas sp. PY1 TaxID=1803906 RepID=UPI001FC8A753|nr:hypothetical protein [Nitrosomonas sp. PY1]GKS69454.1 hypothetical protein W03_14580 [Nitrosomonas sp. PY1]